MPTVVLIRPDGSQVRVRQEDADALLPLGYREQTPEMGLREASQAQAEENYTEPGQKAKTTGEGLLSGLSFGLSDLFLDSDDTKERARYNPGYRIAGELAGGILSPAGAIGDAAKGTATGFKGALIKGATEGALFGGGGAITQAKMSGDPITVESVLAGAGWGSVFGGGLGGLFGKAADVTEGAQARASREDMVTEFDPSPTGGPEAADLQRAQADARMRTAVDEGIQDRDKVIDGLGDRHYREFRDSITDAQAQAEQAVDTIQSSLGEESRVKPSFDALKKSNADAYDWLTKPQFITEQQVGEIGGRPVMSTVEESPISSVRDISRSAEKELQKAIKAGSAGDYPAMTEALTNYKEHMGNIGNQMAGRAGGATSMPLEAIQHAEDLTAMSSARAAQAARSADTLGQLQTVARELRGLPEGTKDFLSMTGPKIEKISGALDTLMKMDAAEFSGLKAGIQNSVEQYISRLGLTIDSEGGTLGSAFRELHSTLKNAASRRAAFEAEAIVRGERGWGTVGKAEQEYMSARGDQMFSSPSPTPKYVGLKKGVATGAGIAAEEMAKGLGFHDTFLRYGAYAKTKASVEALLGVKGAVMGSIADAVKQWGPTVSKSLRVAQVAAPRAEPLKRRITGEIDRQNTDKIAQMRARADEIRSAAPTVRDALYKSISPMGVEHPELASGLHELASKQFAYILDKLPQDPGGAYSALKSLWNPDPQQVQKFEKYYAVFHDPVAEIQQALQSGKVAPETIEGLRDMYPQLYSEFKADLLMRISNPKVWQSMSYSEQVNIGVMLGMPVHSTLRPQFIAAQQAMFRARNDPHGIKPQAGVRTGGGRPPGSVSPGATSAQRITEH